jgi:hypothetical protein
MSPTKTKNPPSPRETATPAGAGGAPAPQLTPEQIVTTPPVDGAATIGAPALHPPGTKAAGLQATDGAAAIGAVTSATIGGLFTSNHQSNAWAYLNGVGWRRLSPANPGAHHAMLQIARLAKDGGITAQCEEDGSVIHAIYLW